MGNARKLERVTTNIDEHGVTTRTAQIISIQRLPDEPAYIKLYVDDICRLMKLDRPTHRDILLYLASLVDYDGIVTLTPSRRKRIAATINCSVKTIANALTEYMKHKLIRRVGGERSGEFELNPALFAKGDWKKIRERREAFAASISYSEKFGRNIMDTRILSADEKTRLELECQGQQRLIGD